MTAPQPPTTGLRWDPTFAAALSAAPPLPEVPPPLTDAHSVRTIINLIVSHGFRNLPPTPSITQTLHHHPSPFDNTPIPITQFSPPTTTPTPSPGPAILYIHGGGLVGGSVPIVSPSVSHTALATSIPVFAVHYRLAPEHPFPTPLDDCYAALEWLRSRPDVDPARICVYGVSGGGVLAASVAQMARDRGLAPAVAKVMLVYPMLDDRTADESEGPLKGLVTWNGAMNRIGWGAYLGGKGDGEVPRYAVPARMEDLRGLPRTYIDVGGCDLFVGEDLAYASRLTAAGVEVEFHLYPGLPHGFESADIPATRKAIENRISALMDF
ncbi:arylesterase/ monooxygenase [Podospora conica]|nr:arylesterase/ monooxygenase [Schizothecium conicum]